MPPEIFFFQEVVLPVLGMGMGLVMLFGGYRLISRALERRYELRQAEGSSGLVPESVRELAARVELLEAHAGRVQELEERLDFAERLLTQGRHEPGTSE